MNGNIGVGMDVWVWYWGLFCDIYRFVCEIGFYCVVGECGVWWGYYGILFVFFYVCDDKLVLFGFCFFIDWVVNL